ncbi:MAG: amidohydrolase family protein [Taibaiella sp.]|jgi:L-fuconolactonase
MQKIDAHQHFWKYNKVKDGWITGKMKVIQKDFMPEDLEPVLKAQGINGCVAIQSDQSEEENNFLLNCADKHEWIRGVIGWIDLQQPEVIEQLDHYRSFPKLKGFRHILQSETDRALMLRPAFSTGIEALLKYNFTYDILVHPDQLIFARELALRFPEQKFILDHIGKPDIKRGSSTDWEEDIKLLATCKNVYCKISGMVTEADWKKWKPEQIKPYLDTVVNAFGINRIMFGSDWPVCLLAAQYEEVSGLAEEYFSSFSAGEQESFWSGNAVSFYNL